MQASIPVCNLVCPALYNPLFMSVFVHVRMHVLNAFLYSWVYLYMCVCMYLCMYSRIHVFLWACMHLNTLRSDNVYMLVLICVLMNSYTPLCMHASEGITHWNVSVHMPICLSISESKQSVAFTYRCSHVALGACMYLSVYPSSSMYASILMSRHVNALNIVALPSLPLTLERIFGCSMAMVSACLHTCASYVPRTMWNVIYIYI